MAYTRKGWRFWVPVIASALGFLIGTSILICFQTVYNNFHAAAWGGASGVLSGLTFILHLAVRFDYRMKLNPDIFTTLMTVGIFGIISGFGAVIGYLVKGIMKKESGIQIGGSFIVVIWSFMTFKWGIFLFYHAKGYKKEMLKERLRLVSSIET